MSEATIARPNRGWLGATLGAVAVALLLPLTVFLVSVWLLGWQLQNVVSGSMSPTYPVGSLLVVGQVDPAAVGPGTVIVFVDPRAPDRLVAHRVTALAPGEDLAFITRGDANATADPVPVPARLVRGRVMWQVSQLGSVIDWLQWPRSFVLLVVIPGLALAAVEIRAGLARRRRAARVDGARGGSMRRLDTP